MRAGMILSGWIWPSLGSWMRLRNLAQIQAVVGRASVVEGPQPLFQGHASRLRGAGVLRVLEQGVKGSTVEDHEHLVYKEQHARHHMWYKHEWGFVGLERVPIPSARRRAQKEARWSGTAAVGGCGTAPGGPSSFSGCCFRSVLRIRQGPSGLGSPPGPASPPSHRVLRLPWLPYGGLTRQHSLNSPDHNNPRHRGSTG